MAKGRIYTVLAAVLPAITTFSALDVKCMSDKSSPRWMRNLLRVEEMQGRLATCIAQILQQPFVSNGKRYYARCRGDSWLTREGLRELTANS